MNQVLICECGEEIGRIELVAGKPVLRIGNTLAYGHHGVCAKCNAPVHWTTEAKALSMLIQHTLELRKKNEVENAEG